MRLPPARSKFETDVLDHLDAAYNLARWLMHNEQDAQDVVQESCMKALRAFDTLRSSDFRPWFLAIVRNTSFTILQRNNRSHCGGGAQSLEVAAEVAANTAAYDPRLLADRAADADAIRQAIEKLPAVLREAVVLRELEGLSYKEIGQITGVPIGTVMSRLARGRTQLRTLLIRFHDADTAPSAMDKTP